uniref:MARVEL domain-containing protein n=1 Tax=Parastrongyloides trichosuri TaxID=131310 RepID=A0A0N4ZUM2_PARTI
MNCPTNIVINNNNSNGTNDQKTPYPHKKLLFTTKPESTVVVICILGFLFQSGVYYCFYNIEENGIKIAAVCSLLTWLVSVPFIIGYHEKFPNYKYTNLAYIVLQTLLISVVTIRLCQYTCYVTVHKTFNLAVKDPLKNMKPEYLLKGTPRYVPLYMYSFIAASCATLWLYIIRTAYNLYRRQNLATINPPNKK